LSKIAQNVCLMSANKCWCHILTQYLYQSFAA